MSELKLRPLKRALSFGAVVGVRLEVGIGAWLSDNRQECLCHWVAAAHLAEVAAMVWF
jgi:hypothetical protein